jgi:choline dehydrogenase
MSAEFDFIIVGSGAGGGPLACNLALAPEGFRIALLEAGGDPPSVPASHTYFDYSVPALHPRASEDPNLSWAFFVRHFADQKRQEKDVKYDTKKSGVFYPRAAAVGGCTTHHAMIMIYPHHADWENLRSITGDDSWSHEKMRSYFERLEECRYITGAAGQVRDPVTRHGLTGWLPISMPDPTLALGDTQLLRILLKAFLVAYLDTKHPKTLTSLLDDKLQANGADRQAHAKALQGAVEHLLDQARDIRGHAPEAVRATVTRLSAEVVKEQAETLDVLDLYTKAPALVELFRQVYSRLDPNRWFDTDAERVGVFNTPASILQGMRSSVRERVLAVRSLHPDRLVLIPDALATEVIVENGSAVGVRYAVGKNLYGASPCAAPDRPKLKTEEIRLRPRGEVILSCGAFNTPQLLMLSGIGPADQLRKAGVSTVRCELPGIGQNLHDRYEITLVSELPKDFAVLAGSKFEAPPDPIPADWDDAALREWMNHRGVYATNGAVLSIIKRSKQATDGIPDLFLFGLPGNFTGYYCGYSEDAQSEKKDGGRVANHRRFTWAILKGRTRNRAGEVTLASPDPRDPPRINFKHFMEGTAGWQKDLDALVEGVQLADQIMKATGLKLKTLWPNVDLNDAAKVAEFIQWQSWGHHACGTCKIGKADDPRAVLDGDFRVRGVQNLRVVDASVFPDIPGFFIVTPIYMISEKASDVILDDYRRPNPRPWPKAPGK